jgi:hypothetical protein
MLLNDSVSTAAVTVSNDMTALGLDLGLQIGRPGS